MCMYTYYIYTDIYIYIHISQIYARQRSPRVNHHELRLEGDMTVPLGLAPRRSFKLKSRHVAKFCQERGQKKTQSFCSLPSKATMSLRHAISTRSSCLQLGCQKYLQSDLKHINTNICIYIHILIFVYLYMYIKRIYIYT